tara:strand:+ start:924 stop:1577 length:654 start_codon:yes stop_codon:yes gene_type:complete
MALGSKTSKKFYVTTGAGADKIDATRKGFLDSANTADAAAGNRQLIDDNTLGPLVVNLQEMQDDLDEVRRYLQDSANPPLQYAKITIDASEMAALATTRKTLLAAPGANKLIVPVSIVIMCSKLNTNPNTTLTNLFAGYYNNNNRDIERTPTHATLGLLYQQRGEGSYNVNPVATLYQKESLIVNKEYAMLLSPAAPGANGATTSEVLFCYYIADVS